MGIPTFIILCVDFISSCFAQFSILFQFNSLPFEAHTYVTNEDWITITCSQATRLSFVEFFKLKSTHSFNYSILQFTSKREEFLPSSLILILAKSTFAYYGYCKIGMLFANKKWLSAAKWTKYCNFQIGCSDIWWNLLL